jgi:hypothetical protein
MTVNLSVWDRRMSREGILRNWMDQHDSASSNHEKGNGSVREALRELDHEERIFCI